MASKRKAPAPSSGPSSSKRPAKGAASDSDDFISDDGEDVMMGGAASMDFEEDSGDSAGEDFEDLDDVDNAVGEEPMAAGDDEDEYDIDEDDALESDGGDAENEPAVAKTYETKKGSSLYQAPTNEEMQTLKSGSTLFKSSLFALQLDLLLPSLRPLSPSLHPTPLPLAALLATLQQLRPFLLSLPALSPITPADSLKKFPNLPYPAPGPPVDAKWTLSFLPPREVQIVGDWALETRLKGSKKLEDGTVDLSVSMDAAMFQEKDFLNGRYFFKRSYWLAVVAQALSKGLDKLGLGSAEWAVETGSEWKPVLVLRAKKDKSSKDFSKLHFTITIRPTIPSTLFPASKLSPIRNSLRPPTSDTPPPPTPQYNASLLSDTLYSTHLLYLHSLSLALPAFKDASLLLQLWGSQRGFGKEISFPGWSRWCQMVLGYLVFGGGGFGKVAGGKRLGKGMSSYQVFRGALDFFATHDFFGTPIAMKNTLTGAASAEGKRIPIEEFTASAKAVFVEPMGAINLLAGVEEGVIQALAHEAKVSLVQLNGDEGEAEGEDIFDGVFLRNLRAGEVRYDAVFRIDLSTAKPALQPPLARLDQPSRLQHLINSVSSVVRRALNTRARIVVVQQTSTSSLHWTLSGSKPTSEFSQIIELGVILNPTEALRLVDHGPSADDVEGSRSFREFWGEKSELRRFKDGRIIESVVWDVTAADERTAIIGRSVRHILHRHFGLEESAVDVESHSSYPTLITLPSSAADLISTNEGVKLEGFAPSQKAFADLVRTLKGMDNLPLSLLNVFPVAEGLRYTSVFPPLPIDCDRFSLAPDCLKYVEPLDVVIQFESSGRWPDELAAIQKIKLAFFEKIARSFRDQVEGSVVAVAVDDVLDGEGGIIQDNCSLELLVPSGFAFRLRIHHDREKTLLDRLIADKKGTKPALRRAAQQALDIHLSRFTQLPRHHSAISTLHHLFPSFSMTVRLVKRWFAAHMLSPHVPAELIELICASVYLSPSTYAVPATHSAGFARVIMLLAQWKWKTAPLLVPLYSAAGLEAGQRVVFPKEQRAQAIEAFKKFRASDPNVSHGALFIATEEDPAGKVFGSRRPGKVVVMRMAQIAKATLRCLEENDRTGSLRVEQLFKTPLTDYAFLLRLDPAVLPRTSQSLSAKQSMWTSKYKNLASIQSASSVYGKEIRLGFDPARLYFKDLERIYGDAVILFHDHLGGNVIGGVWNPAVQDARNFKVQLGFSSKPVALDGDVQSQMVRANEAGIIAEMMRLGQGLVEKVEIAGGGASSA